jgi:glyoxylase-like metal-dependent hydrolase (beta-lactamase superfamily II)
MPMQIYPIRFGINRCYLVQDDGIIMIDGGPPNKSIVFQKFIKNLPINPKDIRLIILTHGDFDHVGSARDIKLLTSANIAIHENDRLNFENALYNFPPGTTLWGRLLRFVLNPILKISLKFPGDKSDIVLDNSDYPLYDFGINGKIVYTPGHTEGSVSVLLESGEAFVGCLAHNNLPFRLKPGLPIFAEDIEKVKESWKSIIQQGAKTIYPAHGDPFPVDVIKNILNN